MDQEKCCCCNKIYDKNHPSDFKEKRNGKFKGFYHITEATIRDYKELHTNLAHKFYIGTITCRKCAYKLKDYSKSKTEKQDHTALADDVNLNKIPKFTHQIEGDTLQKEKEGQDEGIYFLLISEIMEKEQKMASRYEEVVKKLGIDKVMEILDIFDPPETRKSSLLFNYLRTLNLV